MGKGGRSEFGAPEIEKSKARIEKAKVASGTWRSCYNPLNPSSPKLPTKGQIKAAIPRECFERSALHSFTFALRDCLMAAALAYLTSQVLSTDVPSNLISTEYLSWIVGWNFYAFWQGCILTGLWVIGHECGHGAFSSSQVLNDIVGFIIHQALLVPYFAWQYTHAKHHRRTNNLIDGESHVPSTGRENGLGPNNERVALYAVLHEAMGDGAFAAFQVFTHLIVGWPLYLLGFASTGRLAADGTPLEDGEFMDHFRPNSKMFPAKLGPKIGLSTITVVASFALLLKVCIDNGFLKVFLWYGLPYLWVNQWLVLYTWLQHTDPSIPQYGADEWTWVKGALATVDRPYGIFDFFHHKIGSTHVAHHLFHEMPFYKADVATAALKIYLGPLYNYNPNPFWKEMWRVAKTCHYVDSTSGVQYYKSLCDIPKSAKISIKLKAL